LATSTEVQPLPTTVGSASVPLGRFAAGALSACSFAAGALSACSFSSCSGVEFSTLVPGGGLKVNCSASGTVKLICWNATRTAGSLASLAYTSTRSGMCSSASIARRTCPISDPVSFGASTSSYAARPATSAAPVVLTAVVGSMAASAASAASCGVDGTPVGSPAGFLSAPAGTVRWVAALSRLRQIHTSDPLRTTSVSPSVPSSASRTLSSPAYQTRAVLLPAISLVRSASPWPPVSPGSDGSPRSAVCTMVPDSPSTLAFCTSTSSWAALRSGSDGSAVAAIVPAAAPPPITSTAAADGTSQRSAGLDLNTLT
jgi:hypothetical protein